ncbi:hypothetical protein [Hyphomicrobium sp. DY-1]|uniref:hypothetical protein n=1 Tax=Hyphomicrobium sp. DY-1 TaxID=3075650 RepID=UPI0039C3C99B
MDETWLKRALTRMKVLGLTVTDLNRVGSKSGTLITDAERKGSSPSIDNFAKLARLLQMGVGELFDGDKPVPERLLLQGFVRGSEMWHAASKKEAKEVKLSFFDKDLVVLEIETQEMQPSYRLGDVVVGPRMVGRNLDNLIGKDVICETGDGSKYLKKLARGLRPGTYNLRSLIHGVDDLESQKISWAAPVEMIIRSPS